jgi:hypothetical protein
MGRAGPGDRGDDECGHRKWWVVVGDQAPGLGDVDLE